MKTVKIPIREIMLNDDRLEGGKGDIESLARNMEKYGLINAVTVVEDISNSYRYRIIAGRRRIVAAESLDWTEIRADIYGADEIGEDSEEMIALSENAAREEMNAIDEGILYANELKRGTPVEELAALFCRNKSTVYQRAKLASLIPERRKLYKNGSMSLHIAAMAAVLPDEAQKKIVEKYGEDCGRGIQYWEIKNVVSEVSQDFIDKLGNWKACAVCSKRTRYSDKTLFPELAESNDRCLDHACYCKTLCSVINQAFEDFGDKNIGDPKLDLWDGKRIVTTDPVPDGLHVCGIEMSEVGKDEEDITEADCNDAEIKEKRMIYAHFNLTEGFQSLHMRQHIRDFILSVTFGPQKFLKVHRIHVVVFFIPDTVAFDLPVVYSEHGTAAYNIKASVNCEEL